MNQELTPIELELSLIESVITEASEPLSRGEVSDRLTFEITGKTLQRRLKKLAEDARISKSGEKKGVKYFPVEVDSKRSGKQVGKKPVDGVILSSKSLEKLAVLDTPSYARTKVSYDLSLIESYVPNETRYVPKDMSTRLKRLGKRFNSKLAAGTYAKNITQRLLIDLSYNSSRLEGNTYSILDTERLVEIGEAADGKYDEETIMILNHKEAILFLIENAEELSITPFVIRNLHQILSQDLLKNSGACGQIRQIEVNITKSSYHPLNAPQQLEEFFTLLLRKAEKISDPFEQSFFLLMHLSYLQAFEDVNKRTARLSSNLPFIKDNLCPLSFVDVPKDDYVKSLIYFYETGDYTPALEVFEWAYGRSSAQYEVVEKSLGGIDAHRVIYRKQRKMIIGQIIRDMAVGDDILVRLEQFCEENQITEVDKFVAVALVELDRLHTGAIMSLGITEGMFLRWKEGFEVSKHS